MCYDLWQQTGARPAGSWPELFGPAAGELMTAWSIAIYIDRLAEAGIGAGDDRVAPGEIEGPRQGIGHGAHRRSDMATMSMSV